MNWVSRECLYVNQSIHPKLISHASNPLPVLVGEDVYRVFFSARDDQNRSSVGAVDIDIVKRTIVNELEQPVFEFGQTDSFYSHGVSIGNVYECDGARYMLFMGWKTPEVGHWRGEIGRLKLSTDLSLELDSQQPFLALDDIDPISLSYPWVMYHQGVYRMWYGSTESWTSENGEMIHVIKYAESKNGHDWIKKGLAIPYEIGVAQAFSRPTVYLDENGVFRMWYSFRSGDGSAYKIGYSSSKDGLVWSEPQVDNSLLPKQTGWDSEMVEYPFVLPHKDKLYVLYNGSGYGKSGFGIAGSQSDLLR